MIVCIQCSMKALLEGREPPTFEGTQDEHMLKYHPDPAKTEQERKELERQLKEQLK